MKLGEVVRFTSDQAVGHALREKLHIFVCTTDHFRAPEEYAFLYISSGDYGDCFPIALADYPKFLEYDSFISCGNLVFYSRQFLVNAKMKGEGQIALGHLATLHGHLAEHEIMVGWQISIACGALAVTL